MSTGHSAERPARQARLAQCHCDKDARVAMSEGFKPRVVIIWLRVMVP